MLLTLTQDFERMRHEVDALRRSLESVSEQHREMSKSLEAFQGDVKTLRRTERIEREVLTLRLEKALALGERHLRPAAPQDPDASR